MALRHATPGEVVDLRPLGADLPTTRTHAIVRTAPCEAVRLVVAAGTKIPTHKVPGRIMLHCIEGQVQLALSERPLDLSPGDWVYLKGNEPHAVRGVEDASLLLTILFDS